MRSQSRAARLGRPHPSGTTPRSWTQNGNKAVEEIAAAGLGDAYPAHKLIAFARAVRGGVTVALADARDRADAAPAGTSHPTTTTPQWPPRATAPPATAQAREAALRRECAAAARACDGWVRAYHDTTWPFGSANRRAKEHFGMAIEACGERELRARLAWLRALPATVARGGPEPGAA